MPSTPVPPSLVQAFAAAGARNAIPIVPSPTPGAASFNLGFPPITMTTDPSAIPPDGEDMNGILYMISAHIAWLAAGGCYPFSADVVSVVGGYGVGAVVQSAVSPTTYFLNILADNTNDPDSVITGWIPYSPISNPVGVQTSVLAAGTTDNLALSLGVGFLDLNPTSGPADVTGISSTNVSDGQLLIVSNINGANMATLKALNGGSLAANQMRLPVDITLPQYSNITLRHSSSIGLWVPAS